MAQPGNIHVMPDGDTIQHIESAACRCGPEIVNPSDDPEWPGPWVVVHNALDGREAVEEAQQILSEAAGNQSGA